MIDGRNLLYSCHVDNEAFTSTYHNARNTRFVVDPEKGYIPTDKAPKEAVEAMKEYNEEYFWHPERLK